MFQEGQKVIVSDFSKKAYFKNKLGRLCSAPVSDDGQTIDYTEARAVDYFFLTTDEWEEAFAILDIMEEE